MTDDTTPDHGDQAQQQHHEQQDHEQQDHEQPQEHAEPTERAQLPQLPQLPQRPEVPEVPRLPQTGDQRVDEALEPLADVDALPPGEQVEVYVGVHRALQDRLADLEG